MSTNGHSRDFESEADKARYDEVQALIRPNPLLQSMKAKRLGLIFTMTICRSIEAVAMAKAAGYEGVSLNLEHERNGLGEAIDVCVAALGYGLTPVIIVPSLQSDWISRLLDNGAQAIIVPRTHNADMAREFVKYSKHRPLGERPLAYTPQLAYRIPDFRYAQQAANETTLTIPMIESVEGLQNCEEIAAVPGVDAIFIGAHDLSDDMGISGDFYNLKLQEAISRICTAAATASTAEKTVYIGIGGLEPYPDLFAKLRKAHENILFSNAGRDHLLLEQGMMASISKFREV
ncbi:hypothetical protein IAR55_004686 [Kwoniella newhampshirensis]|uniref:HpcH/HpaI aldolase/citrate lyase domain-containing protein n=1 Tax=Kwoniella newhampshirensis TaxID=1651941 RepID=A0AAW0YQ46_9TREE